MGSLCIWDYVIIVADLVFAVSIGFILSKKASKNSESYFLGSRSLPWWMITTSMITASLASDTPLVHTEMVRQGGLQKLWWVLISVMALIVGIFLFSRLWRRASITTDAEFYELRYEGNSAALLRGFRALFSGLIQNLTIMGWVIFGMSSIITTMTGVNKYVAVGVCIIVAMIYSTFSGFYGLVVVDFLQFALIVGSMVTLAVISVVKMGGLHVILDMVASNPAYGPATLSLFPDLTRFDMNTIRLLIYILIFWWNDANGYNMQKMSACKNERHAVLATLSYAVFQTCRPWMWVVVGLVSIALFPTLSAPYTDTHAYPLVMNKYLGPGLRGLVVTGFLAAFMSTIDTQLNWGSSYIMTDIYRRFLKKKASEKHYMIVTKIVVVLLMLIGASIVPLMKTVLGAWEFLTLLLVGSGFFSVLRWFWWRVNAYTEISALILGLIIGSINPFIPDSVVVFGYPWTQVPFEIKVAIMTGIVIPISLIVTFLTPPVSTKKLEEFYRRVRPGGFWGVLKKDVHNLPGKALSLTTLIDVFGGMLMCYGISLGIGYSILLRFGKASICFILGIAGSILVYRWYKKEIKILHDINAFEKPNTLNGKLEKLELENIINYGS